MSEFLLENIAVSAGIIWRSGRFLATQRPDGKPFAGYWELPGGKAEGCETPEQTLKRELAEELGIKVIECSLLETFSHVYEERGFRAHLNFFEVKSFRGEPCPKEGQNLRWVQPLEASRMDFLPADSKIISILR